MDAPQGYYATASDVPLPSLEPLFDDESFKSLLLHLDSDPSHSQCFVQDSPNGSTSIMSHALVNSSFMCSHAAQSDCKLQSHIYNRSPSLACTYTPSPSGQVVQLQCLPSDQPLPRDIHNMASPRFLIADAGHPIIMPCQPLPSNVDMSPSIRTFNKPSSPASLNHSSDEFDADTNVMWWKCKQSQDPDPHDNFPFSFSHVEAKHKDQAPYDVLYDRPQLTSSPNMPFTLPSSMRSRLALLDVATSPTACGTMSGTASPAYMQRSIFSMAANSDSAAMDQMSSASAPAALPTSKSSLYGTSTPPERGSRTVPASPTSSVNKGGSSRRARRRSSCDGKSSRVAFKVKTTLLNLHDGFAWKKYGEKTIKQSTFPRSYFKCDQKDRCGCEVLKRTQRCDDKEHVLFQYLGRHNHPSS